MTSARSAFVKKKDDLAGLSQMLIKNISIN